MSSSASGDATPPKSKPNSRNASGTRRKSSMGSKPRSPRGSKAQTKEPPAPCKPLCGHLCAQMPVNIPLPKRAMKILHPTNDVFVLKVAKVGANGDRRCKMEVELVTPKSTLAYHKVPYRLDTREAQCDPCPSCICQSGPMKPRKRPQNLPKKEN